MPLTADEFETKIQNLQQKDLITFLITQGFLKNEMHCEHCTTPMKLVTYNKNKDLAAWRCLKKTCKKYLEYTSVRKCKFFEDFKCDIKFILRVIIKYLTHQPIHSIIKYFKRNKSIIYKIIKKFRNLIPQTDFSINKLGGPGVLVQVDETMMNFKCKSHRGRSPENKTDAISIVECINGITRAYAQVIPNKEAATLIPIICSQVAPYSVIWTDEHRSYSRLRNFDFFHGTVCHKFEFINNLTGVNTQCVESFHNAMKYAIKNKKGILTSDRPEFLKDFLFFLTIVVLFLKEVLV